MVESLTPAFSQASMILSQRLSVISSGFSTITCLPAWPRPRPAPVGAAGRADGDDVDGRVGQHVVQLVIRLAADCARPAYRPRPAPRRSRPRACARERRRSPGVKVGDHAAADNAKAEGHVVFATAHSPRMTSDESRSRRF